MLKQAVITSIVALGLALSGCAGKGNKNAGTPISSDEGSGFATSGTGDSDVGSGQGLGSSDISGLSLQERTVYFEYDSSEISASGQAIVTRFAKALVANPSARLRLEGHADERGTREYNVGLGERRANSVQSALVAQGVSPSQISLVSYGEERPAVPGSSEADYAQNRRVEIVSL